MVVSFPRDDIFSGFKFSSDGYQFKLVSRQEYSRAPSGVTRGKDFGSAIWVASYTTIPMEDGLDFEAVLNSLDGVIHPFYAGDLRRPFPKADPKGEKLVGGPSLSLDFTENAGYIAGPDAVKIASLGSNGKSLSLKGLPPDYVLSRGDYLSFDYGAENSRALHQVMEASTADGDGETPEFEVRPHIRPGAAVNDAVTLDRPSALMVLSPGSVTQQMQGPLHTVVSFQATQII